MTPPNCSPAVQGPQSCGLGDEVLVPVKLKFSPVAPILKLPAPGAVARPPPVSTIEIGSAFAVEAQHRSTKGSKRAKVRVLVGATKTDERRRDEGRITIILLKRTSSRVTR